MEVLYRYENWQTAGPVDEWGYTCGPSTTNTGLREYEVIRTTPKGVWIEYYGSEKFVKLNARKRFACPTKEEALASFVARKEKQIRILKAQLRNAAEALRLASTQSS
jgi:hypothetical protein